ncbi:MAG: peptidylprolyl isomerase [Clostridium sp.]|nr:peptidylprolyl isomerase [Clostridium sp.]
MKKKLICILAVLLLVTSCGKVPKLKNGDEAVVTMKDGDISVEELYSEMKEKYALDMLITKIDTAILNNVYKTDDEEKNYIDKQLETIKYYYETYYKSQYKSFQEYLTQNGVESEDELKENIRLTYKRNKAVKDYVKSIITDKEIEKYYDEEIFGDISASHILIKPEYDDNASDEEKKEAEKKALKEAKEVIAKLKKGEDFAELAKEYSDDSSNSKSGGKLADFNHGQMVEAFEDAAKELKVGSYTTTPVKTEFGYHIILKTAQKDKPALKEVKDDIISDLTDEKLKDDSTLEVTALVELRKKHKVEIQDKDIKKLYEAYVEKNTK